MTPEANQAQLRQILADRGWTHQQMADELSAITGDSVSVHAVRSWLANPRAKRARPCPGWPLAVLAGGDQTTRGQSND